MLILTTFAIAPAVVFNATVAKPAEGSSNRYEEAKNPALKQKYCQLYLVYLEGMGLRAIGRYLGIHYKTVTRSLVQAAQALPWHQIKHLPTMGDGTDMLQAYENFIPNAKHYVGKTCTTQIESPNCRLRHYLARPHRKTLCYSKSKTMWEVSLKLLIHQLNNS